jgi:nicotinamide mononucleotide (NMN) deamidase PncC
VWVAVDVDGAEPRAVRNPFVGDRDEIRFRAAQFALDLVRRAVVGGPLAPTPPLPPHPR